MNSDGEFQRLKEPRRREVNLPYEPYRFAARRITYLPIPPETVQSSSCLETVLQRITRRAFAPIGAAQLGTLLWFSAKTHARHRQQTSIHWEHRPAPSAGGLHPIHLLIIPVVADEGRVSLYDPHAHALIELEAGTDLPTRHFVEKLSAVVHPGEGTIIWFAADFDKTLARYEAGESLVWRDAGALAATIGVVAEAMDLNCCAIGLSGDDWIATVLPSPRFGGVGGCVVGSRIQM